MINVESLSVFFIIFGFKIFFINILIVMILIIIVILFEKLLSSKVWRIIGMLVNIELILGI